MKIAVLSDFHLGYERFREDAYKQAEVALNSAAEVADVIIIPGDIFDNRTPKPEVIAEAITLFRALSKRKWQARVSEFRGEGQHYTDIPIIAIPGTHERRAQDATDPVDLLGLVGLVVDVSNATAIVQKGDEKIAIVGIGGIADERFKEIVTNIDPRPVPGIFSVFIFHESVYELLPFNQSFIKQDELPKGFDLYLCGHIHSRVDSEVHGKKFLIPGSTVLTQLKSGEQESKGFYLYDTISGKYEFNSIKSRRFVVLKVNMSDNKSGDINFVEKEIENVIKSSVDEPIIRVIVEGKFGDGANSEIDLNNLPKRYHGRAIVEVSKSEISVDSIKSANLEAKTSMFENMSVKDYGIGVFVEKLKSKDVKFGKLSAVELFELLSAEGSKEKVVSSAIDHLLE